ncbi:MAG TPA: hypothetical protein VI757_15120 [Bacteroidia bacterium]|nr:hypothetical protein [Bacteroidia bacterium]
MTQAITMNKCMTGIHMAKSRNRQGAQHTMPGVKDIVPLHEPFMERR